MKSRILLNLVEDNNIEKWIIDNVLQHEVYMLIPVPDWVYNKFTNIAIDSGSLNVGKAGKMYVRQIDPKKSHFDQHGKLNHIAVQDMLVSIHGEFKNNPIQRDNPGKGLLKKKPFWTLNDVKKSDKKFIIYDVDSSLIVPITADDIIEAEDINKSLSKDKEEIFQLLKDNGFKIKNYNTTVSAEYGEKDIQYIRFHHNDAVNKWSMASSQSSDTQYRDYSKAGLESLIRWSLARYTAYDKPGTTKEEIEKARKIMQQEYPIWAAT